MLGSESGVLEFFAGAGTSMVWGLFGLFIWWLMFLAPVGRRRFESAVAIAATPEKIWSAYVLGPEPEDGWTGLSEVQLREFLYGEPMRIHEVTRLRAGPKAFKAYVYRVTAFDAPRLFETCTQSRNGVDVEPKAATRATLTLTPRAQTTEAVLCYEHPVRGLYKILLLRRIYARMLERLRARCEDRPMPGPARGVGWRTGLVFAALALAATIYAMGGMSGGWPVLVSVALMIQFVIVVHELGHWLAMRWFGHRDATMTMIPFFGGAALGARPAETAFEKAIIALMGPAFSAGATLLLLIPATLWSGDLFAAAHPAQGATDWPTLGRIVGGAIAVVFVLIATPLNLLNLAPFGMMDGARIADALAEGRVARAGARLALVTGLSLSIWGMFGWSDFGPTIGLLAVISLSGFLTSREDAAPLAPMTRRQRALVVSTLALTLCVYGAALRLTVASALGKIAQAETTLHARGGVDRQGSDERATCDPRTDANCEREG